MRRAQEVHTTLSRSAHLVCTASRASFPVKPRFFTERDPPNADRGPTAVSSQSPCTRCVPPRSSAAEQVRCVPELTLAAPLLLLSMRVWLRKRARARALSWSHKGWKSWSSSTLRGRKETCFPSFPNEMGKFDAVVFDLGGVVLGSPLEGIADFEREVGIPAGFVNVSIVSKGREGAFQRLERGEIDMKSFYDEFRRELGEKKNIENYKEFLERKGKPVPVNLPERIDVDTVSLFEFMMRKAGTVNKDMCHALFVLRGLGFKVAALTNNWQMGNDEDSSSTKLLKAYFDMIIESSKVNLRKPDPRIYKYTEDQLGVTSEKICFLDDIGMNLAAAKKLGWTTVKVNIGETTDALRQLAENIGIPSKRLLPTLVSDAPTTLSCKAGPEGSRIVFDCYGSASDPPVVFLHGGGQTRQTWDAAARVIAASGFFCLTVDQRGHGESDWDPRSDFEGRYHIPTFSEDLDRLVDMLRLDHHPKGCALVGASMGGLAILWSHMAKDAAKALVLVDIAPRMELEGVHRVTSFMSKTSEQGFESLEEARMVLREYNPSRSKASIEGLRKNLRKRGDGRWTWHWDPAFMQKDKVSTTRSLNESAERLIEHARHTNTPCLLVRGRQTDIVSLEGAKEFVRVMPDAKYVDVKGASHMIVGDRNDIFTSEVLKFLKLHFLQEKGSKL